MAILLVGVLGIAMLIPLGKIAMSETDRSDRTGACGRAALREVRVRRMLDSVNWSATPSSAIVAIDPLGYAAFGQTTGTCAFNLGGTASTVTRITLKSSGSTLSAGQAEAIFRWRDDLTFVLPKDRTDNAEPNGDRPSPFPDIGSYDGGFSWFLTVAPQRVYLPANTLTTTNYSVAVVVCCRRQLTIVGRNPGEQVFSSVTCDNATGYGGVGVSFAGLSAVKENQWVLLCGNNQSTWYRVASAGYDDANNRTRINLVGPDWHNGTSANPNDTSARMIVVDGVTGVYTTTVQAGNSSLTWGW